MSTLVFKSKKKPEEKAESGAPIQLDPLEKTMSTTPPSKSSQKMPEVPDELVKAALAEILKPVQAPEGIIIASAESKRRELHEFLESLGVPEMGEGSANRLKVVRLVEEYVSIYHFNLKEVIRSLSITRDKNAIQRKEKSARKSAARAARNSVIESQKNV